MSGVGASGSNPKPKSPKPQSRQWLSGRFSFGLRVFGMLAPSSPHGLLERPKQELEYGLSCSFQLIFAQTLDPERAREGRPP